MAALMAKAKQEKIRLALISLVVVGIVGLLYASLVEDKEKNKILQERFEKWAAEHGRVYKDEQEKEFRFKIFKATVRYVESVQRFNRYSTLGLGLNNFADISREEYLKFSCGQNEFPQEDGGRLRWWFPAIF